ncbi:UvrB/UvrC motif-containing protein [Candidatus Omnitrophota bacterium]
MVCDICTKNPATVHLTEIVDDQMTELHLCEECARQKSTQMEQQFGLSDLLAGLAEFEQAPLQKKAVAALKCPGCGLTYADFKKLGRLGCGQCYGTFKQYLAPLLKKIHGSSLHLGKSPVRLAKPSKKKPGLTELRSQLQKAVDTEAFEEAARIRDKIKGLDKKRSNPKDSK